MSVSSDGTQPRLLLRVEEAAQRLGIGRSLMYRLVLSGAVESVRALAAEWPLGLASSSNRHVIDLVLEEAGIVNEFKATVSSEEVGAGKPAPDVYLEAARRLDADPGSSVAIEDSTNGLRSAHAAEMTVIAVPNRDFPPEADALALAAQVLDSLEELTPERIRSLVTA